MEHRPKMYVYSQDSWNRYVDAVERSLPVPRNWEEAIAMGFANTPIAAKSLISAARKFGFADANGDITPRGNMLRVDAPRVFRTIADTLFGDLLPLAESKGELERHIASAIRGRKTSASRAISSSSPVARTVRMLRYILKRASPPVETVTPAAATKYRLLPVAARHAPSIDKEEGEPCDECKSPTRFVGGILVCQSCGIEYQPAMVEQFRDGIGSPVPPVCFAGTNFKKIQISRDLLAIGSKKIDYRRILAVDQHRSCKEREIGRYKKFVRDVIQCARISEDAGWHGEVGASHTAEIMRDFRKITSNGAVTKNRYVLAAYLCWRRIGHHIRCASLKRDAKTFSRGKKTRMSVFLDLCGALGHTITFNQMRRVKFAVKKALDCTRKDSDSMVYDRAKTEEIRQYFTFLQTSLSKFRSGSCCDDTSIMTKCCRLLRRFGYKKILGGKRVESACSAMFYAYTHFSQELARVTQDNFEAVGIISAVSIRKLYLKYVGICAAEEVCDNLLSCSDGEKTKLKAQIHQRWMKLIRSDGEIGSFKNKQKSYKTIMALVVCGEVIKGLVNDAAFFDFCLRYDVDAAAFDAMRRGYRQFASENV